MAVSKTCATCKGRKMILTALPFAELSRCPACNGTGKEPAPIAIPVDAAAVPLTHEWVPLGFGDAMCKHCKITNREAAVLGWLNKPCASRSSSTGTADEQA